ncbi:MAG: hypothetical protein ACO1TE_29220 [Prosthecobacter sp.]
MSSGIVEQIKGLIGLAQDVLGDALEHLDQEQQDQQLEEKSCALSRNCPEACPILDRFNVRLPS